MDFELSHEQRLWQQEVRAFLAENADDSLRADIFDGAELGDHDSPRVEDFYRRLAARGWHSINWPSEYGGLARSAIDRMIFMHELDRAGAPPLELTVNGLAPVIIRCGTDENKQMWLAKIAAHEVTFALGYSEPDAGTDLASLKTRAELDGDEWVINGTKLWNSAVHHSTHVWMLVRTSTDVPKHRGLSLIIVPTDSKGIEYQAMQTWGEIRTNASSFVDVRVPKDHLIGEIGHGWEYIVAALDLERMQVGANAVALRRFLDEVLYHCSHTSVDGRLLIERPEIRHRIAELMVEVDVVDLLSLEIASAIDRGETATVAATTQKVMSSELRTKVADFAMNACGLSGQIRHTDPRLPMGSQAEFLYRQAPVRRFAGGTNEVMRDVIAQRGLGLPRSPRGGRDERHVAAPSGDS